MPFIHYHVGTKGKVNACCVAPITYGNVNKQTVEEIWNGEPINQLRTTFLQGQPHAKCSNCIQLELSGAKSIRQETFEKFDYEAINLEHPRPRYFDIRFSNVCNFRCRTCWHGASSKWYKEAKQLGRNASNEAIISNVTDFDKFVTDLGPDLLLAEEFYFAGGEPLVTEQHYSLLNWLIDHGATKARLRYNTNFSTLYYKDYDLLSLWSKFDSIEIMASIDGSNQLGEYIRKDMKWDDILSNHKAIKGLPNISFCISPTISIFNISTIVDLYKESLDLGLINETGMYTNILQYPAYYSIQILAKDKKQEITSHILSAMTADLPMNIRRGFQDIIEFMNAKDQYHLWPKFIQETQLLNQIRNETTPMQIIA